MISYLEGKLVEKHPTNLILDVDGVGYFIKIPLSTFENLGDIGERVKVFSILSIRNEKLSLFGFSTNEEREFFEWLIRIRGIGGDTALRVLSSISFTEFKQLVKDRNIDILKNIKGIGKKRAETILFELKDSFREETTLPPLLGDATNALVNLGFKKEKARKTVESVLKEKKEESIETIIREALKRL